MDAQHTIQKKAKNFAPPCRSKGCVNISPDTGKAAYTQ